jgi:hypothetical protein
MQLRIGDRDPVTGLYKVIWPDGSSTLNGLKIYNAAHQVGDPVMATRRDDGMLILDNPKAADPQSLTGSAVGNRSGYLNGQVFNTPEEEEYQPQVRWFAYYTENVNCQTPAIVTINGTQLSASISGGIDGITSTQTLDIEISRPALICNPIITVSGQGVFFNLGNPYEFWLRFGLQSKYRLRKLLSINLTGQHYFAEAANGADFPVIYESGTARVVLDRTGGASVQFGKTAEQWLDFVDAPYWFNQPPTTSNFFFSAWNLPPLTLPAIAVTSQIVF